MKKIFKISLICVLLLFINFFSFKYIDNIKADSGWDSSYDSGDSWDSGSDWGGSSGGFSGGSNGRATSGNFVIDFFVGLVMIIIVVIAFEIKYKKSNKNKIKRDSKNQLDKSILHDKERLKRRREYLSGKSEIQYFNKVSQLQVNEIIPNFNIEEFNLKAYQIFCDVQVAWMNFDYEKLKELLTDELYNNYVIQLEALKSKNKKNTMKDFELIDSYIYNLKEENDKYIAEVYLDVNFFDYVENSKTGMILRGTPNRKLNNIYKLTFIRTKDKSNNLNECPRCGAIVEGNSMGICEYCKSKLVNNKFDWVMSKKEIISQRKNSRW